MGGSPGSSAKVVLLAPLTCAIRRVSSLDASTTIAFFNIALQAGLNFRSMRPTLSLFSSTDQASPKYFFEGYWRHLAATCWPKK